MGGGFRGATHRRAYPDGRSPPRGYGEKDSAHPGCARILSQQPPVDRGARRIPANRAPAAARWPAAPGGVDALGLCRTFHDRTRLDAAAVRAAFPAGFRLPVGVIGARLGERPALALGTF